MGGEWGLGAVSEFVSNQKAKSSTESDTGESSPTVPHHLFLLLAKNKKLSYCHLGPDLKAQGKGGAEG